MHASKIPWPIALITHPGFLVFFSVVSLLLIVVLSVSAFVYHPFDGLALDSMSYPVRVIDLLADGPTEKAGLEIGDEILSIDGREVIPWGNSPIYRANIKPGEYITFDIRRDGQILEIPVEMGDLWRNTSGAFLNIALILLLISSWGVGAVLTFFAPEGSTAPRLIGFHWQLMGVSFAAAVFGRAGHFWGANTAFLITWALLTSTNVIIHLYFPEPVFALRLRRFLVYGLFLVSLSLAVFAVLADWHFFPQAWAGGLEAYENFVPIGQTASILVFLGFLISFIVGIAIFIRCHFRYRKTDPGLSRQTRIVIWGMIFGTLPLLIFSLLPALFFEDLILSPEAGFLFFILIPLAYAYAIYQKRLLRVDLIINQALVMFLLILTVLGIGSFAFLLLTTLFAIPDASLPIVGGVVALFVAIPMPGIRHRAEIFVTRVMYGEHYDYAIVTADFSSQLAQTIERDKLAELLTIVLPRRMGILQSALYLAEGGRLIKQGEEQPVTLALDGPFCQTMRKQGSPVRPQQLPEGLLPEELAWGQLFGPLLHENQLYGLLVLGARMTGDLYHSHDLQIITTISQQTALAYVKVLLVELHRGLARQQVKLEEKRRKQAAYELHDAVLQNLLLVKERLLSDFQQVELASLQDTAIQHLRRIMKSQRPFLLDRNLVLALQDLVNDMQVLAGTSPEISWYCDLDPLTLRVNEEKATAVYRIAQEALSNTLKHAQASAVAVKLERKKNGNLLLMVQDDGVGMAMDARREPGHYGLEGMRERALMIGGDLHISSYAETGTTVILGFAP